jgi:hypothetical protein
MQIVRADPSASAILPLPLISATSASANLMRPMTRSFSSSLSFSVLPTVPDLLFASPDDDFGDDDDEISDDEQAIRRRGNRGLVLSNLQKTENRIQMDLVMKALDMRKLTGTKALSDSSLTTYGKHFRGLIFFLTLLKDHKSMLILQEHAPMHLCPSVDAKSIVLFYKWKLLPKGTALEGTDILSTGSWKDPKQMDQFRAAMVALHKSRGQGGEYQEPCSDCLRKYDGCLAAENFQYKGGCRQHPSNPLLWRTGNPVTSSAVEDCVKELFRLHSAYVARGDSPITPSEILKLRTRLLSSNSLQDFQMWTMILIACRLFLREDEVASMRCEDIVSDITSVHGNGHVEGIAFKIQGKSDVHPVTLMMWSDAIYPSLCPVNALLSWISLTKIRSGYLFPSFSFLCEKIGNSDWNGSVYDISDVISYSTFLDRFKKLCKSLLDRDGPFGTHTCRKTAYLLGAWGGGGDLELMQAARHKTLANAVKYKKDALFLLNIAKSSGNDVAIGTPVWRPLFCENYQLARSVNANARNFIGLHDMATKYSARLTRRLNKEVSSPLDYAEGTKISLHDFEQMHVSMEDLLKKCPDSVASQIRTLYSIALAEAQSRQFPSVPSSQPFVSEQEPQSLSSSSSSTTIQNESKEESAPAITAVKRKNRGGNIAFEGFNDLASIANPVEKLTKLLNWFENAPEEKTTLTEQCRKYYYETLTGVHGCYHHHCNESSEVFLQRWPKSSYSKFVSRKCTGISSASCGETSSHHKKPKH